MGTEGEINNRDVGGGSGFGGADPGYGNLAGLSGGVTGVATLPTGFSMGIFGEAIEVGGVRFPSLGAIIQAYKKDEDINILSTPQILTTDNEEASINVGKNVPYQTRQGAVGSDLTDIYFQYEYKDVGQLLKITPHISQDRYVRLTISYEGTSLDDLATTAADRPTTLKRAIETTVIVKDKDTVVIGGLIDDSMTQTSYRVPCLGDIPILGWMFRTDSRAKEKTNLYVFLTPQVVANPAEAAAIFENKKTQIENQKKIQAEESDLGEMPK